MNRIMIRRVYLPPSVRRYNYEGEDHFCRILAHERELLLESIPSSRKMTNIDTASGSTKTEPNIERPPNT